MNVIQTILDYNKSKESGGKTDITKSDIISALGYTPISELEKGANSGIAELDDNGKVLTSELPSYVDDVEEFNNLAELQKHTGEASKIYITLDDNKCYRWGGTAYVEISSSITLGETSGTAFRGDLGKEAYDKSHTHSNKEVIDSITSGDITNWNNKSDFDGKYTSLTDTPTIPTVTNDLTNELKANYDLASTQTHTHSNKELLDKLSLNKDNKLLYNGDKVDSDVDLTAIIDDSTITDKTTWSSNKINTAIPKTWVGTKADYEQIKDTLENGTIVYITDDETVILYDKAEMEKIAAKVAEDRTAAETAAQTAQAVADSLPEDYVTAVGKIAENTTEINNTNSNVSQLKEDLTKLMYYDKTIGLKNGGYYSGETGEYVIDGNILGYSSAELFEFPALTNVTLIYSEPEHLKTLGLLVYDKNKQYIGSIENGKMTPYNTKYLAFNLMVKYQCIAKSEYVYIKASNIDHEKYENNDIISNQLSVVDAGLGYYDTNSGDFVGTHDYRSTNYIYVGDYLAVKIENQIVSNNHVGIIFLSDSITDDYKFIDGFSILNTESTKVHYVKNIIPVPYGAKYAIISFEQGNLPVVYGLKKNTHTRHVEEIDLNEYGFSHDMYSISGEVDVNNSDYYMTTKHLIRVGRGNAFRVSLKPNWKVSCNYHPGSYQPQRSSYDEFCGSNVFYAKDDYVRLAFEYIGVNGKPQNISQLDNPPVRMFIVNNGVIDPKDFGAIYDGITDCTNAFQTCLDYGTLKVTDEKGIALCSTLEISQDNTNIEFSREFVIKLKDNTNDPLMITPAYKYLNNDEKVNYEKIHDINIIGGIWDGNGENQSKNAGAIVTKDHNEIYWWSEFLLLDIEHVNIIGVTIKNPWKMGILIGNISKFTIRDLHFNMYGRNYENMDGIHLMGDIEHGLIDHVYGVTHDDMVAINCDGDWFNDPLEAPRRGSAKHIEIRNITSDNGYRAVRLLCGGSNTCDDILIDGVHGVFHNVAAIHISCWADDAHHGRVTIQMLM